MIEKETLNLLRHGTEYFKNGDKYTGNYTHNKFDQIGKNMIIQVHTIGRMDQCMKVNLRMALDKVKENGIQTYIVKIVINTLGNIMKIKRMVLEFINGQMDLNIRDISKMT